MMNVGNMLLDIAGSRHVECAAPAAGGAYGAASAVTLAPGAYLVRCDADVVIRESSGEDLRTGSGGNKIEFPVSPQTPLPVFIRDGRVIVAARDAAAIVWFVPLVVLDGR